MWLETLSIKHFRNYEALTVTFHEGLNVFLGQNAQGKTNILEAIYFLALTRSHRTRTDKDLVNFQEKDFRLTGLLHRQTGKLPLEIALTPKGRVTKVNHLKQTRLSDYIGHLNVILFAPEDLQLIKGAPALRRKFMDMELGQIKAVYLSDLYHYNHLLKQRNSYLKTADQVDQTYLEVLDEQLADYGSRVMLHRAEFIQQLGALAGQKHQDISNGLEQLRLHYDSSVPMAPPEQLKADFLAALKACRKRDLFKKNTGVGPHRDDLRFFINDMNADFGSQGQHRSVVLSLKLAEIDLMAQLTREAPILLLDDVMSELDNTRQLKLLSAISDKIQTFITTTSLDHLQHLPKELKIFHIQAGTLKEAREVDSKNV